MADTKLARLGPWPKGMLLGLDASLVPEDALYWAHNVNIEPNGAVVRRPAIVKNSDTETIYPEDLHEWITDNGQTYNIVATNESATNNLAVYRDVAYNDVQDEDDVFALTTPSTDWQDVRGWDFVQLNSDDLYLISGWQTPSLPTRLNWTNASTPVTTSALTAATFAVANPDTGTVTGHFPYARHGLVKHERVFVANVDYSGGSSYPSRICYSDLLKPEAWYGDYYIDVDPDHGGSIYAMVEYGDAILIFKENAIYMLSGSTPDTFAITKLTSDYGTFTKQSVVVDGSDVYFFDNQRGIIRFTGEQFINISKPFSDWITNGALRFFVFEGYLYARIYTTIDGDMLAQDAGYFIWRYNTQTESWSVWEMDIRAAVVSRGILYLGVWAQNGIYTFDESADYDQWASGNDNVNATVVTGIVSPATPGGDCRLQRVDLNTINKYWKATGSFAPVSLYAYRDFSGAAFASTSVSPSATARNHRLSNFGQKRFSSLRFEFNNNDQSGFWGVSSIDLRYLESKRQRGVDV